MSEVGLEACGYSGFRDQGMYADFVVGRKLQIHPLICWLDISVFESFEFIEIKPISETLISALVCHFKPYGN